MHRMIEAMLRIATLATAVLLCACGSEDDATTTSSGSGASSTTGTGGTGGVGGSGTGGSAAGGMGGMGGTIFVDPIAGIEAVEELSTGYQFTEGPAWFESEQVLRFSDIPNSAIHEVSSNDSVSLWRSPTGNSNGIAVDPQGRVVMCEGGARQVTRVDGDPNAATTLVDDYLGDRLNAPNDVIVRSDGTLYFTDPDYGLQANDKDLAFQGVFRLEGDGTLHLVDDAMDKPNGIALSPDEASLYVTDAAQNELWRFDIAADGSTSNKTKLADTNATPDGFAVDDQGYLYLTTAAGIDVHSPDGALFGNVPVPLQPANCTFGGADRRRLYITARESVFAVELNVPGLP
jgi:gluconolactonase